jgi:hypothetical protein
MRNARAVLEELVLQVQPPKGCARFRHSGAMGLTADMRSQKEWIVPQRHFRMPAKKVVKPEQTEEERPQQQQPDTERDQLQIDRQTKRSFKTSEAARSAALEIKSRFPILQVSIYDNVSNSRTVVDVPKSI